MAVEDFREEEMLRRGGGRVAEGVTAAVGVQNDEIGFARVDWVDRQAATEPVPGEFGFTDEAEELFAEVRVSG